jgi:hypothetical protein
VPAEAEAVALLLAHLRAAGQPIRLAVPAGSGAEAAGLADALRRLLDEPVELTEAAAPTPHAPHSALQTTTHVPLDRYQPGARHAAA